MLILIVEDQALLGMSLAWDLEDAGHKVLGPISGIAHAQRLAAQERPDLVLIDIELQRPDEAIALAQSLQTLLNIPSLFLTSEPSALRAHTTAALGVIAKPFNPADIHRSVAVAETIIRGGTPPPPAIPCVLEIFQRVH